MVRAFRDTWELGIHSYLTYLRDRLLLARDLLHESGSVFAQISDDNLHHIRELLDEVFGAKNSCGVIPFKKTSALGCAGLDAVNDYLLWYAAGIGFELHVIVQKHTESSKESETKEKGQTVDSACRV